MLGEELERMANTVDRIPGSLRRERKPSRPAIRSSLLRPRELAAKAIEVERGKDRGNSTAKESEQKRMSGTDAFSDVGRPGFYAGTVQWRFAAPSL